MALLGKLLHRRRRRATNLARSTKRGVNWYGIKRKLARNFTAFFRFLLFAFVVCGISAAAVAIYFLQITQIRLERTDAALPLQQVQASAKKFMGRNLLFLRPAQLEAELKAKLPFIDQVEVTKLWPNALKLKVYTYPILLKWQCAEVHKKINKVGEIIEEERLQVRFVNERGYLAQGNNDEELLTVIEHGTCPAKPQTYLFSPTTLEQFKIATEHLSQILGQKIKVIIFYRAARELHLRDDKGLTYWLDLQRPFTEQLDKLQQVSLEQGEKWQPQDHVDLRIPDKIFYK